MNNRKIMTDEEAAELMLEYGIEVSTDQPLSASCYMAMLYNKLKEYCEDFHEILEKGIETPEQHLVTLENKYIEERKNDNQPSYLQPIQDQTYATGKASIALVSFVILGGIFLLGNYLIKFCCIAVALLLFTKGNEWYDKVMKESEKQNKEFRDKIGVTKLADSIKGNYYKNDLHNSPEIQQYMKEYETNYNTIIAAIPNMKEILPELDEHKQLLYDYLIHYSKTEKDAIPEHYWENAGEILFLVETKRADNLKEALNVYENMKHQERLEAEQRRQSQLAEDTNSLAAQARMYAAQAMANSEEAVRKATKASSDANFAAYMSCYRH